MTSFWLKWRNWWRRRCPSSGVAGCRRWNTASAGSHDASKWAWSTVTWSPLTWRSGQVRDEVTHILTSSSHCSPSRHRITTGTYRPSGPVTQAMYSWQSVDDGWRLYRGWFAPHVTDDSFVGPAPTFRAVHAHNHPTGYNGPLRQSWWRVQLLKQYLCSVLTDAFAQTPSTAVWDRPKNLALVDFGSV